MYPSKEDGHVFTTVSNHHTQGCSASQIRHIKTIGRLHQVMMVPFNVDINEVACGTIFPRENSSTEVTCSAQNVQKHSCTRKPGVHGHSVPQSIQPLSQYRGPPWPTMRNSLSPLTSCVSKNAGSLSHTTHSLSVELSRRFWMQSN